MATSSTCAFGAQTRKWVVSSEINSAPIGSRRCGRDAITPLTSTTAHPAVAASSEIELSALGIAHHQHKIYTIGTPGSQSFAVQARRWRVLLPIKCYRSRDAAILSLSPTHARLAIIAKGHTGNHNEIKIPTRFEGSRFVYLSY
jgi:hypothetical protein